MVYLWRLCDAAARMWDGDLTTQFDVLTQPELSVAPGHSPFLSASQFLHLQKERVGSLVNALRSAKEKWELSSW